MHGTVVASLFTPFRFKAVEKYVPFPHLCRFNSNFNAITRPVTGNMAVEGLALVERDGDNVS
jgi:hypothetical protein